MIRMWQAGASGIADLPTGPDGALERHRIVTEDDLAQALVAAATVLDKVGGHLFVTQKRAPTGLPDESVTTQVLIRWSRRTDDTQSQPEAMTADAGVPVAVAEAGPELEPTADVVIETDEPLFDDGMDVDRDAVDESDPELQATPVA